jgi:hypothetical protein
MLQCSNLPVGYMIELTKGCKCRKPTAISCEREQESHGSKYQPYSNFNNPDGVINNGSHVTFSFAGVGRARVIEVNAIDTTSTTEIMGVEKSRSKK